jgi:hypothetical protein
MLWHLHFYLHAQRTRDLAHECQWLEEVRLTANGDDNAYVTWSANHAAQRTGLDFPIDRLSLLPNSYFRRKLKFCCYGKTCDG